MDIFLSKSPKYRYNKLAEPLQSFFRKAPVGFAIVDSDNFIVEGNDKFCQMFGCAEAQIVNRKITDLACDDPLDLIKDSAEKEIEIKYRNLKGTIEFYADTVIKPVADKEGKLICYFLMTYEVKKSRIFEIQILELSVIIDQSPASIVITDTEGRIQFVNPAFEKLTGYTFEEILGKDINILKSGKVNQNVYNDLWKTVSSGKTWKGELINKKKNGEPYTEFTVIAPIKEKNGKINYFVSIKEDITLLKDQERKLRESERLAAIGKMASYLLHEIKSPFASIKMNFDQLKNSAEPNDKAYNIIEREVKRLDKLLNDVLQYSKEKDLEIVNVNLNKAVDHGSQLLEPLLRSRRITFVNKVEPVTVKADSQQLKSLFLYLFENSIEALEDDGEIEAWSVQNNGIVEIYFKDSGSGVDNIVAEKIFEPFFTSKAKGSGLGLALAKKIIEKHSGTIGLFDGKKGNTTFKIIIPVGT